MQAGKLVQLQGSCIETALKCSRFQCACPTAQLAAAHLVGLAREVQREEHCCGGGIHTRHPGTGPPHLCRRTAAAAAVAAPAAGAAARREQQQRVNGPPKGWRFAPMRATAEWTDPTSLQCTTLHYTARIRTGCLQASSWLPCYGPAITDCTASRKASSSVHLESLPLPWPPLPCPTPPSHNQPLPDPPTWLSVQAYCCQKRSPAPHTPLLSLLLLLLLLNSTRMHTSLPMLPPLLPCACLLPAPAPAGAGGSGSGRRKVSSGCRSRCSCRS